MNWLEITINTSHSELPRLIDRLSGLGVDSIITEDEEDIARFLEENKKYWDYVDEAFAASIKGVSRVKFYFEDSESGKKELTRLENALPEKEFQVVSVRDEDWENNWRQYYKPILVGERLVIVPEWLALPEDCGDRIAVRLDPGLIFGTGGHATTQMCLKALEKVSAPGKRLLDLGCGSGILAIAGLLLGCDSAVGIDIDDKAPKVVMENAAFNGIGEDRLTAIAGDVIGDKNLISGEKFPIITANIVADVIIALAPRAKELLSPGGDFICSGIIDGRTSDVEKALKSAGFEIIQHFHQDNWNAYLCK